MKPFDHPHGYYRRREQQEREMAASATDQAAMQIHLALAEKYRKLADAGDPPTEQGRPHDAPE